MNTSAPRAPHWARLARLGVGVLLFILVTTLIFTTTATLTPESSVVRMLEEAGMFGAVLIGVLSGLNPFLPIPPATFAPLFTHAGLGILFVILGFAIGTTIADTLAFFLGRIGKRYNDTHYPKVSAIITTLSLRPAPLVFGFALLYFIFVPFPNELILIPFGLAGYSFRILLPILMVSNLIHHTLLVFGYQELFTLFF